jgi:2-methylcitrate dehydratase PrpD
LFDQQSVRIANLIEWEVDESLGRSGIVEVTLTSGEVHTRRVDQAPGHRDNPLPDDQRQQKFIACAQHAGSTLSQASLRQVIDLVAHLEDVPDVRVLGALLSGG